MTEAMGVHGLRLLIEKHAGVSRVQIAESTHAAGSPHCVAYVVPNVRYLDDISGSDDSKRLERWRTVYDWFEKGRDRQTAPAGMKTSIWNSIYTKDPIPPAQMQEWCDLTIEDILRLRPSKVLEIGVGTGALMLKIAPQCAKYVGIDFSAASLNAAQREMDATPGNWGGVRLFERQADDLDGLPTSQFDTVVINSVTQCFPSERYLTRVLARALDAASQDATIFIGDVRSLPLLPLHAVSVELFQATPVTSISELRHRVRKRLRQERELVISPAYFLDLQRRDSRITSVQISPKRARSDNEMTKFRYDVTLRLGHATAAPVGEWIDWTADKLNVQKLRSRLEGNSSHIFSVRGVPNSRLEPDIAALRCLQELAGSGSVGFLRENVATSTATGATTAEISRMAAEAGYRARLSWARSCSDGSFDVVFDNLGNNEPDLYFQWPAPSPAIESREPKVLDPGRTARGRRLRQELTQYLETAVSELGCTLEIQLTHSLPADAHVMSGSSALLEPLLAY